MQTKFVFAISFAVAVCVPAAAHCDTQIVIEVTKAKWVAVEGEKSGIETESTLRAARHKCDGLTECAIKASNAWFEANDPDHKYQDPANNHRKHLSLEWICKPAGAQYTPMGPNPKYHYAEADENEDQWVRLTCN
jgi:hypothetical protein